MAKLMVALMDWRESVNHADTFWYICCSFSLGRGRQSLICPAGQSRGGAVTRVLCTHAQELTTASGALPFQTRHFESPYLVYHEKIKTSRVFIRDCSMVSVYPLVLLGGGQVHMQLQKGEFVISLDDGWIRFVAASHQVTNRRENAGGRAVLSGISGASRSPLRFTTSARSPSW